MSRILGKTVLSSTNDTLVRVSTDGELFTTAVEQERATFSIYKTTSVGATQYCVLVDLSDTTNFHHDSTGRVDISHMGVVVEKGNTTFGDVSIGVVTAISSASADISYFFDVPFDRTSDTFIRADSNYSPAQIKCSVSTAGKPNKFVSNDVTSATTLMNNLTALASPLGSSSVTPAVGDIVAQLAITAGTTYSALIKVAYHSH